MNEITKKIMSSSKKIRKVVGIFYGISIAIGIILLLTTVLMFFLGYCNENNDAIKAAIASLTLSIQLIIDIFIIRMSMNILLKISNDGRPFQDSIYLNIKNIGILILISNIVMPVLMLPIYLFVLDGSLNSLYNTPLFSFGNIFLGFVVLLLSKVFKYGVELQDESDRTL